MWHMAAVLDIVSRYHTWEWNYVLKKDWVREGNDQYDMLSLWLGIALVD